MEKAENALEVMYCGLCKNDEYIVENGEANNLFHFSDFLQTAVEFSPDGGGLFVRRIQLRSPQDNTQNTLAYICFV